MSKKVNKEREHSVTIITKTCSDGDVSVANVEMSIISTIPNKQGFVGDAKSLYGISSTGRAVRAKGDTPNAELGEQIALARALHNVSRRYAESINGLIKHQDDIQSQRKEQKDNKAGKIEAYERRRDESKAARVAARLENKTTEKKKETVEENTT